MTTRDGDYPICPHCGTPHFCAYNSRGTGQGSEAPDIRKCAFCDKSFVVWTEYDVQYCTKPVVEAKNLEPAKWIMDALQDARENFSSLPRWKQEWLRRNETKS